MYRRIPRQRELFAVGITAGAVQLAFNDATYSTWGITCKSLEMAVPLKEDNIQYLMHFACRQVEASSSSAVSGVTESPAFSSELCAVETCGILWIKK